MNRHLIIPDTQNRKGTPTDHIRHAALAILEYRPTRVIVGGDWWDMPSLSQHDKPGSKRMEGARYEDDVAAGNEAWELLWEPLRKAKRFLKIQTFDFLFGNHEMRIDRAVEHDPKWEGKISRDDLHTPGATRHEFNEIVWRDNIAYSHYFTSPHSPKAISGSADAMLTKIGDSFVAFHQQGMKYVPRMYPTGKIRHGLQVGSFYRHDEHYRGAQGKTAGHWNGIVVLNDVRDGNYEIMPLSIDYLARRFGKGKSK